VAKTDTTFAVYSTPMASTSTSTVILPEQYKDYQDVFEKKNADILPQ